MGGARYIGARAWDDLSRILTLVPQGNYDINCDNRTSLQCLECSGGESCQYTVPLYCAQCATSPSKREAEAESHEGGSDLTTGGIIGGIIGSIVIISVATYLVWRFYIKPKRPQTPASIHIEAVDPMQSSENDAASGGTSLGSKHTAHSMTPTILTRASNIIQIAYIPGVTNRTAPMSSNLIVTSAPLIPMHHAEGKRGHGNDDQHYFIPSDLQASTYSKISR